MATVNIREAKTHFSSLIERALAGEEIVIARAGKPVARLVPYQQVPKGRIAGRYKDQIWMADDFLETPREIIDEFYRDEFSRDEFSRDDPS